MKNRTPFRKRVKSLFGMCTEKGCKRPGRMRADIRAYSKDDQELAKTLQLLCSKHLNEQIDSFLTVDHDVEVEMESGAVFRWSNKGKQP